jgi:Mg2+ and Co2+ transporter CorA
MNVELPGDEGPGDFWFLFVLMTATIVLGAAWLRRRGWL